MKPLARTEFFEGGSLFDPGWIVLVDGDCVGDFSEKDSADDAASRTNAAHRAAVKKELEAFRDKVSANLFHSGAFRLRSEDYQAAQALEISSKDVRNIDIDAFLDREEK